MNQSLLVLSIVALCSFTSSKLVYAASDSESDSDSNNASDSKSDESPNTPVHISKEKDDGRCVTRYVIKGETIDDIFTTACYDENLKVVWDEDSELLIVGDLKAEPFTLYSNTPDTLVVIEDGKCTKKLYIGPKKKKLTELSRSECRRVMKSVSDELKKRMKEDPEEKAKEIVDTEGSSGVPNNHGNEHQNFAEALTYTNGNSGFNERFLIKTTQYEKKGKCQELILVLGKDFNDMFSQECAKSGLIIMQQKDNLIVGDPEKDSVALYSDSTNEKSLIIINKKKCTKRTYLDDDDKPYKNSEVKDSECKEVMKKIKNQVEKNRKYWEQWEKDFNKKMDKM